jgi:hypothetical protein
MRLHHSPIGALQAGLCNYTNLDQVTWKFGDVDPCSCDRSSLERRIPAFLEARHASAFHLVGIGPMFAYKATYLGDRPSHLIGLVSLLPFPSSSEPRASPHPDPSKLFCDVAAAFESGDDIALLGRLTALGILSNRRDFPYSPAFEEFHLAQVLVASLSGASAEGLQAVALEVAINACALRDSRYARLLDAHGPVLALHSLRDRHFRSPGSVAHAFANLCHD